MAYTKITSAYHGAKAISYLLGESHKEGVERNKHLSGINMVMPDAVSYTEQMQTYWNKASDKMKVQVRRVTQSASRKEIDPENEADLLKFHEIGIETGRRIFGNRQFLVATQIDGKSGLAHNHIFANNVDFVKVKGMRGNDYQHSRIKQISDKVFLEYGIKLDKGEKHGEKYTQTERAKRENGEYVWKDDLKERIRDAMATSCDWDSFEDALAFEGVSIRHAKGGVSITYTLDDTEEYEDFYNEKPNKPFKIRGKRLGSEFDVVNLETVFMQNQNAVNQSVSENIDDMEMELEITGNDREEVQEQSVDSTLDESANVVEIPCVKKSVKIIDVNDTSESDSDPVSLPSFDFSFMLDVKQISKKVATELEEEYDEYLRRKESIHSMMKKNQDAEEKRIKEEVRQKRLRDLQTRLLSNIQMQDDNEFEKLF